MSHSFYAYSRHRRWLFEYAHSNRMPLYNLSIESAFSESVAAAHLGDFSLFKETVHHFASPDHILPLMCLCLTADAAVCHEDGFPWYDDPDNNVGYWTVIGSLWAETSFSGYIVRPNSRPGGGWVAAGARVIRDLGE